MQSKYCFDQQLLMNRLASLNSNAIFGQFILICIIMLCLKKKGVDDFEIDHKHANSWLGVYSIPLRTEEWVVSKLHSWD